MQADNEILIPSSHQDRGNVYEDRTGVVTPMDEDMIHEHEEELSDDPSSPDSTFETDLMSHHHHHDVHTDTRVTGSRSLSERLAQSGPVGVAAVAAISSFKRKRRMHMFETNPAIRKRQQTRLLRKIRACIEEYTVRVGQQAAFLAVTPPTRGSRDNNSTQMFKVFGSQPLENVIRSCRTMISTELEGVIASQVPPPADTNHLFELPPLVMDGIPTPLEKMTQAHLRAFIPEMLKFSTGRSKPGWGKTEFKPCWWPSDVPWQNIRCDCRMDEVKKLVSWTDALRAIIRNCYKHHCREDLLPIMDDSPRSTPAPFVMQTINNPDGSLSIIQIDTSGSQLGDASEIITLGDGTQAAVVRTFPATELEEGHSEDDLNARLAHVTEATLSADGTITLADGSTLGHESGMVQLPVSVYGGAIMVGQMDGDGHLSNLDQGKSDADPHVPPSTQTVEIS